MSPKTHARTATTSTSSLRHPIRHAVAVAAVAVTILLGATTALAASVSSIAISSTAPSSGAYKIGDTIELQVNFDSSVNISGTPWLWFQMGDSTRLSGWSSKRADCSAGNGITYTLCRYTVTEGDTDADGISTEDNALHAVGGTITDSVTDESLTAPTHWTGTDDNSGTHNHKVALDGLAVQSGHKVDGVRPDVINTLFKPPKSSLDGKKIYMPFNELLGGMPDTSRIRVTINGTDRSIVASTMETRNPWPGTHPSQPTGSMLGQLKITLSGNAIKRDDAVFVTLSSGAVKDAAGNGYAGSSTRVEIAGTYLRMNSRNTSVVRGATVESHGADAKSYISFSVDGGGAVEEDHAIHLTWNDAPISELDSRNTDVFTFGKNTECCFWLWAQADTNNTYDKPVKASLVATIASSTTITASDNLTVIDDDGPPTASLSVSSAEVDEGDGFRLIAHLSHPSDENVDVHFAINNPSEMDMEGIPSNRKITVLAGNTTAEHGTEINKRDDTVMDGWGVIYFSVNSAGIVNGRQIFIPDFTQASVKILDDDTTGEDRRRYAGWPQLILGTTTANEAGTDGATNTMRFPVTLYPTCASTVTANYETVDGSAKAGVNYTATSGTLTFATHEGSKTVSVPLIDDGKGAGDTAFELRFTSMTGCGSEAEGANGVEGRIRDATPTVSIHDAQAHESGDGTIAEMEFTVSLFRAKPEETYEFTYGTGHEGVSTATAGADYIATSGSVTFGPGETRKTISVDIVDDNIEDSGETFRLRLTGVVTGDELGRAQLSATGAFATGTILNEDPNAAALTASFSNLPTENWGGDFIFDLTFSAEVSAGYRQISAPLVVDGGSVARVWRKTRGSNLAWKVKIQPTGNGALTITLMKPQVECGSQGAICSKGDNLSLSNSPRATIPAAGTGGTTTTPSASISGGTATEGTDATISFTVTLSEAATDTVTVDYASADGSASAGSDYTSTSGTLTLAAGTTTGTITVAIADDSVNEASETFIVTLSNASGATLATSTATGTISNRYVAALTASFSNVPSEHGGAGAANRFSFELSFSENVKAGWKKLKNRAFVMNAGSIKQAKRKTQGSNQHWTITVEPTGWGTVTITLPGGRACGTQNAVCTYDDRPISNTPAATVAGPASLSVADATANENTDSGLDFAVTLDRSSNRTITVAYATSDGTATAGEDYTSTSGTLTFTPGDTAKTVTVPVLNDVIDDGGETLRLRLSDATNARIADASATGTINNDDPLQQAWIARFGRTVATDVVAGITDRLANPRSGSTVQVGGLTLERNASTWAQAPREEGTEIGRTLDGKGEPTERQVTGTELLLGSAFHLQGQRDAATGTSWAAWGRVAQSSFDGQADTLMLSGDVTTGLLGADIGTENWTAGIAMSIANGDGPFGDEEPGGSAHMSGTVVSTLTSLHPYAQVSVNDDVDLWGIAGYGTGAMTIDTSGGASYQTDIDMMMAAAGVRGQILDATKGDALDSSVRGDVLWLRTTSDKTKKLARAEADVTRLRLMIDAGRTFTVGTGTLTPTIEAGVRHDAGDAEEGVGFEVGGGLAYRGHAITLEAKARTLIAHEESAYEEWGASFAIRVDPGSDGRGLSLSITPTWGSAASEAEQLWSTRSAEDLVNDNTFEADRRIDAELGYGVGGPGGFGTLTPYAALSLTNNTERTLSGGLRWNASQRATLNLEATRAETTREQQADHALMLRAQIRF